jgi:hypothetical protein
VVQSGLDRRRLRGLDFASNWRYPNGTILLKRNSRRLPSCITGYTSLLTARMAERLKALGLAEQKFGGAAGGTGLTEQGRKLFESR